MVDRRGAAGRKRSPRRSPRRAPGRALIALAWLAAQARAETRPPYGSTVEGSLLGAPVVLDPVAAQSHAEVTVVGLVFDTLYATGPGGTEPHLAIGLPVLDPAGAIAHVALRRGVRFHDASVMTASDVVDSLDRVRGAAGWVLAPIAQVRAAGDGIDLALRAPGIDVASLLALPQTAITRRGQAPAAAHPVGSGPFAVERLDLAGRELVLRAFDDHFAGRPYLNRLVLRWFDTPDAEARRFETGTSQLSARGQTVFPGAVPKFGARAVDSPAAVLVFVGFGRQHAQVTGEPGFRRALDLALDRGAVATITTGERTQPTRLPLPPEAGAPVLGAADAAGNAARALQLLDEVGARVGALARPGRAGLKLAIVVDETRPDDREIALRVARGLEKLGIGFTIQAVPAEKLRDQARSGSCDLWIGQIAAPIGAPAVWWGAAFAAGRDDWAQRQLAGGAIDPAAAAQEFGRGLPIVPLMFRSVLIWHRADVRGLGFDATGRPTLADLYWPRGRP
jgi:ABC-type transport system substrate-binding protein